MRTATVILTVLCAALLAAAASAQQLGDYGDAPEGAIAYPNLGVMGAFPTCTNVGPANWIFHGPLCWANFPGAAPPFDFENNGNANLCPQPPYDNDECFGIDAGLQFPVPWTIVNNVVVPCPNNPGGTLGVTCTQAAWGGNLDIMVVNGMPVVGYVNVLFDWDQNGGWGGGAPCPNANALEHVLVNFPVPIGYAGPLSGLNPPGFLIGPNVGYVWSRFTISDWPVQQNWDGSGSFEDGETEDYLMLLDDGVATQQANWSSVKSLYR